MLEKPSCCKVNLLLNILGKRPDGFHELETIMQPVPLHDRLTFERQGVDIALSCNDPSLPVDARNLVYRAADLFRKKTGLRDGVRIHLEKCLPIAAGLGGGSANAAVTFLAMNELFGSPLAPETLHELAAALGSDIPFFLQSKPALATGRGEKVQALEPFAALRQTYILLVHPGFGISTGWAYQQLAHFPAALNGRAGRAAELLRSLAGGDQTAVCGELYNSLEAPALQKYPLLQVFQEFFREHGAWASLMSGSGSTTFALIDSQTKAEELLEKFKSKLGHKFWLACAKL